MQLYNTKAALLSSQDHPLLETVSCQDKNNLEAAHLTQNAYLFNNHRKADILQNRYGATGLLLKITVPSTLLSKSDFAKHHLNQAVMQAPTPNPFKLTWHRGNSKSRHMLLQHVRFSSNTISTISSIFSRINSSKYIYINSAENTTFDYETNRTSPFKIKNYLLRCQPSLPTLLQYS